MIGRIDLGPNFDTANATPKVSDGTQKVFKHLPKYFDIWSLSDRINSFIKSQRLYEDAKRNPIKAKVLRLLAASLIVTIIIAGAIGAHYALKTLTPLQGKNWAAAFGILAGTIVVSNIVGAYFNHRWNGYCPSGDDYHAPFIMSFFGIYTPISRTFSSLEKIRNQDFEGVASSYNAKTHQLVIELLDSQPQSSEIVQAKQELQTIYDFFGKETPTAHIEMEELA